MLLTIKLYCGLTCRNQDLESFSLSKFQLEVTEGTTLGEVHKLLGLNTSNSPVSIVDGHAQHADYILSEDCKISIFPPMADKQYNFFERI